MANILSVVGNLISEADIWVHKFFSLFFTYTTTGTPETGLHQSINGISVIGLFCVVLPLVGLGIGIIRRLVKVRA